MDKENKEKAFEVNKDTIRLIDESLRLYKNFINKPTEKTLRNFIDTAKKYKESFLEDEGRYQRKTNAMDIRSASEFLSLLESDKDFKLEKDDHGSNKYEWTKDQKLLFAFKNRISKEINRREAKGLGFLRDIQLLNRAIHHFSKPLDIYQNPRSIQEERELTIDPSLIKRFQGEDQYGNTKGPLKLFGMKTNVPNELLNDYGITTNEDINFSEFQIAKYRHNAFETEETDLNPSRTYIKAMPRRTYFDAQGDGARRFCWFESRKEIQYLARYFIDTFSKDETLIDSRIGLKQEMNDSRDLTKAQYQKNLKKFSFNDEEYKYFKENNFQFLTFTSNYNKSPRQMLRHINYSGTPDWIDVCLYSPYQVTIRSFTNDLEFIPSVSGYTGDSNIGWESDIFLMSNELPKLSHQALNFFSHKLDKEFRESMNIDSGILILIASDPEIDAEDIAIMEGLEKSYVLSILKDILNQDNYNFDTITDSDLFREDVKETLIESVKQSAKSLIEKEKLKNKT